MAVAGYFLFEDVPPFARLPGLSRSLELKPCRLLGDSAYGSAEMLGWLVYEHGIEPHVTVFDKSTRQDGTFSRDDFTYDHVGDVYSCPAACRIKIEAIERAFYHAFCGQDLGLPDRGCRFDINNNAVVDIDQIVGGIGEECLSAMGLRSIALPDRPVRRTWARHRSQRRTPHRRAQPYIL